MEGEKSGVIPQFVVVFGTGDWDLGGIGVVISISMHRHPYRLITSPCLRTKGDWTGLGPRARTYRLINGGTMKERSTKEVEGGACKGGAKEGTSVGDWGGCFLGSAKQGAGGGGEQAPIQIQSPCLTSPGPGSLRCPVCLSTEDCESATELMCPAWSTHCYQGAIQLRGGNIFSILRVQGCTAQPGCNLLNGTQKIGPIEMSEDCSPRVSKSNFPTCERGVTLYSDQDLSQIPRKWNTDHYEFCKVGEVCQETLLLVDVGQKSIIVGSKGCSKEKTQDAPTITVYSGPPGVLVASYAHFCSSNRCNRASNTNVLLQSLPLPAAPAPGNLQCPVCVNLFGSCPENPENVMCPIGTTHCYSGYIMIREGGVYSNLNIQGCVTQASSSLLNHAQKIGVFSVTENSEEESVTENENLILQAGAAPVPLLAWVVGLGLSLALWCEIPHC
ncbi:CD177 antigen-like [Lutra lutra]|uniref:CD177 antigen-like n=1 Tax=Lutra lutra TaxID=9657 RepID=UPI001FD1DF2F|nr:CD177 antigen-like [Lutra lutra]